MGAVLSYFPVLENRFAQMGGTLSGGEQQMLAIGRALMSGPKLLVLDEPAEGLAPAVVEKLKDAVHSLNRDGMTILLVEAAGGDRPGRGRTDLSHGKGTDCSRGHARIVAGGLIGVGALPERGRLDYIRGADGLGLDFAFAGFACS